MNLVELLKKDQSVTQRDKMVRYIGSDSERFSELVKIFLKGPYRITQRASWPLTVCAERHPSLVQPHLKKLIVNLKQPGLHDAVKRNTVRLMQFIDIPKGLQGMAADVCYELFTDRRQAIAVRVFAMTVLANIAEHIPELRNELIIRIEDELPYGSSGFVSRGRKLLRKLKPGTGK